MVTAAATAAVIGVLNVDDFYEPAAVARGVEELRGFAKPGLVSGDCRIVDTEGNTIVWNRPYDLRLLSLLQDSYLYPIPANPSAYFYHREVHDIVGGYDVDDHYSMDLEFLLVCARRVQMKYVNEHWGNFRLMPGCKTFEDSVGPQRVTQIIGRHRQSLTRKEWMELRMRGITTEARIRARHYLRRMGLPRS